MTNQRVTTGHLGKVWDDDFKYLPYKKQPVTNHEIETWRNMGYDYVKSFTGSMYDNRNPMPLWIKDIEGAFGLYNQAYTFYKMSTLEIMPVHRDHYRTYARINNVDPSQVCRAILMLEDWKPGHYFELDGVGYTNWKAGDWFMWQGDTPHAAANIGVEDRYTLQVTGQTIYSGQMNTLICQNVPNTRIGSKESTHPFFKYNILPRIENSRNRSFMVYMDNSSIKQLSDINHDLVGRDKLNKNGLSIYLYEPLCSYIDGIVPKYEHGSKHTQGFYSEFDHTVDINKLRSDELDSILDYVNRNKLTNVTVHTCDYDVEKYYPYYNSKIKLITDDLFLKTQENIQNLTITPNTDFTNTFMCLNWRYTKHRNILATYLANRMNASVSWYFKIPFEVLCQDLPYDLNKLPGEHLTILKDNTEFINSVGPLVVDKPALESTWINHSHFMSPWPNVTDYSPGVTPALHNGVTNNLEYYYNNIFVDVINETRFFQPTANFSEKVFQAMQYMKPFIVVGPPKTLEYIKSFGFNTFDEFWDESYDDEYDHIERLIKIFKLIDRLNSMSIVELKNMYNQMIPLLEQNVAVFKEQFANPKYSVKRI